MDVKTFALVNLIVQAVLIGVVGFSGYLARVKRELQKHCTVMRIAVPVLIVTVILVMAPSFAGYLSSPFSWFYAGMLLHVASGLTVISVWVYANLVMMGVVKARGRLVVPMRIAASLWVVAFILGLVMYLAIWL
ncbi:MAG: hypothetical protein HY665_03395 [Chloroflexi bacterium]|nr:hypothetical protein [Chloroflexota bacterium]